ncbi:MAG TPA: DUF3806 domain-containing protein [Dermatophilaceae bacterium]|nr:DUF3806 domain-containing protein [Dermatophilaceae bacterium]
MPRSRPRGIRAVGAWPGTRAFEALPDYAAGMGWFSRKGDDAEPARQAPEPTAVLDGPDGDFVGRPVSEPLTEAERTRIDSALDELSARGIDVDDLQAISSAYDSACAEGARDEGGEAKASCEVFGIAIGEYLARHSTLRWAIVTDTFGTDLGLAAARSETVVVPHNLVSARWMRREKGWIPGVVGHLVQINQRG